MPTATPKKPKKKKKGSFEKTADTLFSKIIRAAGACRRCGSRSNLQCAHIVSRSYHAVRWDIDNAVCLCAGCHVYFTHRPIEWEIWIEKTFDPYHFQKLKERALEYHHPPFEEIIEKLTSLLKV